MTNTDVKGFLEITYDLKFKIFKNMYTFPFHYPRKTNYPKDKTK